MLEWISGIDFNGKHWFCTNEGEFLVSDNEISQLEIKKGEVVSLVVGRLDLWDVKESKDRKLLVYYDEEACQVVINDKRIDGFIDEQRCLKCGENLIYYETFDAYFCVYCNVWTETKCGDPDCMWCSKRPVKPL